jgi:hypothetical protein
MWEERYILVSKEILGTDAGQMLDGAECRKRPRCRKTTETDVAIEDGW